MLVERAAGAPFVMKRSAKDSKRHHVGRRAGRKRRIDVGREPNGRPQREAASERAEDAMAVARAAPHRRGLVDPDDRRAATEFGRLRIARQVTPEQYAAGLRWAGIVARYHAVIAAPRVHAQGCGAVSVVSEASPLDEARGGREISPEAAQAARAAYNAGWEAVDHGRGSRAMLRAIREVVIHDRPWPDLEALRLGLDRLAAHFEREDNLRRRAMGMRCLAMAE